MKKELEILILSIRIHCQDIGMEYGTEKYVKLIMKSGKRGKAEGINLFNQEIIRTHGELASYIY